VLPIFEADLGPVRSSFFVDVGPRRMACGQQNLRVCEARSQLVAS
jgi:hypothetical protein